MARRPSTHAQRVRQGRSTAGWLAYLLLCAGILYDGAALGLQDFTFGSRDLPARPAAAPAVPVARIQSIPDRNNQCRALIFHNDSGRYQDAGTGKCILDADTLVWTVRGRSEAFAEAFKSAWKGDTVAPSP